MTPRSGSDAMSEADFGRIAAIARQDAGIELPRSKIAMVQSRVFRHMRRTSVGDGLSGYLDMIEGDRTRRHELVSVLTTNVTGFFREPHHFDTLRHWLDERAPVRSERIRIWSAGCSGGHEAYSIAMTCHDLWTDVDRRDLRILATDIDREILAQASSGLYAQADMDKIDQRKRDRFFRLEDHGGQPRYRVAQDLANLVTFRQLNLHEDWPMNGPFDAIFCRNVVIYFSEEGRAALWPRFHDILVPGGLLFIGHSERIDHLGESGFEPAGVTTFRKRSS